MEGDIILICFSAVAAVFSVLVFLALIIWLIGSIFPYKEEEVDETGVYAAINTTYSKLFPKAHVIKITHIEERR